MISFFINEPVKFTGINNYRMNELKDFIPEKAVLVHMTDYFPKNGEILSTKSASKDKNGISKLRNSIHFAFNQAVPPNSLGFSWNNKPIGIIAPFNKVLKINPIKNILGGQPQDFYIKERVKLPKGTVIIRYNNKIPKGKLKIINSNQIDELKHQKYLTLIETSDNVRDITNNYIEKMGYTRLDKLFAQKAELPNEFTEIDLDSRSHNSKYQNFILNSKNINNIIQANSEIDNSWQKMAKEIGFNIYKSHQTSPYGRSEFLVDSVNILAKQNNNWDDEIKTFNIFSQKDEIININYKTQFINVIDNINKNLKQNEELSYDINKFKKNIIESQTPSEALEKLKEEQKIIPMDEKISLSPTTSGFNLYESINNLLDLFSTSNKASFQ